MTVHSEILFYTTDPSTVISTTVGGVFVWTGASAPDGNATIFDDETGVEGQTLDSAASGGETATANIFTPGGTSDGSTVEAGMVWTLQDSVTGEIFEVAQFNVTAGGAVGSYTLSEIPLVAGRSYETLAFESAPDASAGGLAFSYSDYDADAFSAFTVTAPSGSGTVDGTNTGDLIDATYVDGEGDSVTAGDDVIVAGGGDDSVLSGDGADTIDGGSGADILNGGDGDDTFILSTGFGNDTITGGETGETSGDTLDTSLISDDIVINKTDTTIRVFLGDDTAVVADVENIITGSGDDLLGGINDNSLTNEGIIQTGAGNDTIYATASSDGVDAGDDSDIVGILDLTVSGDFQGNLLDGGEGGIDDDTLELATINRGDWTVTYTSDEGGTLEQNGTTASFENFETLKLYQADGLFSAGNNIVDATATTGGVNVLSSKGSDTITGGSGNDTITGGPRGSDSLTGGEGDDFIHATSVDAVSHGDAGNDTITANGLQFGGDGDDVFDAYYRAENAVIEGGETNEVDGDTLDLDQRFINSINVTYTGDEAGTFSGSNFQGVNSFSEIENLVLTIGNDTLDGSADSVGLNVIAGTGNDSVLGGSGNDSIVAGDGSDTIQGGTGDDTLTGGDGNDTFTYNAGDGNDTITDFNFGNTGTLTDGDNTNNDFIDLSAFYDRFSELHADQADDGILNQSNDGVDGVDYSDNSSFGTGSLTINGAIADKSFFTNENTGVVCFAQGTLIRTERGEIPIELLRHGDLVLTRDNGVQPIVWIGSQHVSGQEMACNQKLKPIHVAPEITGGTTPLIVSPQHGLLVRIDGADETLVRATHLARMRGGKARVLQGCRGITYFHLMFEAHQIIFANDAPAESFYPGPNAFGALSSESRTEVLSLFPDLVPMRAHDRYGAYARPVARFRELPDDLAALAQVAY